ncbi:MAG TPA: hypothetical protein VHD90_25605 [Phototrophicaceae bacterium]|nr:hypothetical protein [Phototrophicaceae bacterium]
MNKFRPFLLLLILLFPLVALHAAQQTTPQPTPQPRLEITGVNASQMPTVSVSANVYDTLGQPVQGLNASNFAVTGDLTDKVQISKVENISDDNLPFATVLAIDISTSMAGKPLDDAKQAAHAYIQSIRDNDPVAIITFASHVTIVQNYTTDKNTLNQVIDSLEVAGETALYQGAYEAIDLAASSPTPRRALILLSDGAEYGNISHVDRGAPAQEALVKGVPVYTIGLGYGFDRTFMQQLSSSTNAHFNESPTPDQLTQIYTSLAAQLRSQYVITLTAPLPLDGTEYSLGLEVTTPQGQASASATLRAPIPVPIVSFAPINGTLTQATDVTPTILHDDPLKSVTFTVSSQQPVEVTEEPYTFTINPEDYPPGNYTLTAAATDNNGDTGTAATGFTIGALPSQIQLSPDLASLGAISKAQTVTIQATGQTPAKGATVDFNHSGSLLTLTAPFSFTLDPLQFQPGNNSLTVTVTNEGGVTSSKDFAFKIAALPPQITISGLQDGQTVDQPLNFTVTTTSQTPVTQLNVSASEFVLTANADGSYTLDPAKLPPGDNALVVQATSSNQQFGQAQVNFVVPALPPTIIVNGLMAGEVLHEDRAISLDFVAQQPVIHVAFFVDGADLAHEVHTPYGVTIKVLDYTPGSHILRIIADEANGQESTLDLPFSIAPEPAATATAAALAATQAALATTTQIAQATATQVAHNQQATATQIAQVSATAAQASLFAQATATQAAQNQQATATQIAQANLSAQASATQAAQNQQMTATQAANNQQASATQAAQNQQMTATQIAQANLSAQATATQAAQIQQATATDAARATQLASNLATLNAQITATAISRAATATQQAVINAAGNAQATQRAITNSTGTAVAQASATQAAIQAGATQVTFNVTSTQAALNMGATQVAYATATQNAQASATQSAQNQQTTATQIAQATVGAQATMRAAAQAQMQAATLDALSTANAQARLQAQATQSMRATRSAEATVTQAMNLTSTAVLATATQLAVNATATAAPYATATQQANATATQVAATEQANATATAQNAGATATGAAATQIAQQTLAALESTATQVVIEATQTRSALETQTALDAISTQVAVNATSTQSIQATQIAVGTMIAQVTQTEQQVEIDGTATAYVNATMTQSAASTATSDAATLDTRLTAIGPTATPISGGAQNALTLTPQPSPTLTEVQAQQPPIEANIAPIAVVLIVIIVIIVVLVLILRRPSPPTPRR